MQYRQLGRTGFNVSEVSFGAWAIGGSWGGVDDETSLATLHRAIDRGVNFIDTADVYGDGRSERLIARLKSERPSDTIYVATKLPATRSACGRGIQRNQHHSFRRAQPDQSSGGSDRSASITLPAK